MQNLILNHGTDFTRIILDRNHLMGRFDSFEQNMLPSNFVVIDNSSDIIEVPLRCSNYIEAMYHDIPTFNEYDIIAVPYTYTVSFLKYKTANPMLKKFFEKPISRLIEKYKIQNDMYYLDRGYIADSEGKPLISINLKYKKQNNLELIDSILYIDPSIAANKKHLLYNFAMNKCINTLCGNLIDYMYLDEEGYRNNITEIHPKVHIQEINNIFHNTKSSKEDSNFDNSIRNILKTNIDNILL